MIAGRLSVDRQNSSVFHEQGQVDDSERFLGNNHKGKVSLARRERAGDALPQTGQLLFLENKGGERA
eukprot:2799526-Rhodomonas_salina.1